MKLTEWLAIYAALLSTIVFGWNVLQSRAQLKVMVIYSEDDIGLGPNYGVRIFVQNRSAHVVHIARISLGYARRKPSWWKRLASRLKKKQLDTVDWVFPSLSQSGIDDGCPTAVQPRSSYNIFIPEESLREMFADLGSRSIEAKVHDSLFNDVYSEPFKFD